MMTLKYNDHPIHVQTDAEGDARFYAEDVYTAAGLPTPDGSPVALGEGEVKEILGIGITLLLTYDVSKYLMERVGELFPNCRVIAEYLEITNTMQRAAYLAAIDTLRVTEVMECPE